MSLMLWGVVFLLLGLVTYLGGAVLVGPSLPHEYRQKIGRFYVGQAMMAAGRLLLVARKNGSDLDLAKSEIDTTYGQEKAKLGGETQRFEDPDGSISRLAKRSFGIANEADGVITTPRDIELGEMESRKVEHSEHQFVDESQERHFNPHVEVPAEERLVRPTAGTAIVGGNADASAIELVIEFVKKAQAGFNELSMKEAGAILTAYLASAGLMWLLLTQGGGGGGTMSGVTSNFGLSITFTGWI